MPQEQLFQNGFVFDAWSYESALIREAKTEIILIDNYDNAKEAIYIEVKLQDR